MGKSAGKLKSKMKRAGNKAKVFKALHRKHLNGIVCGLALVCLMGGGFMGVSQFAPQERDIGLSGLNEEAVTLDKVDENVDIVGSDAKIVSAAATNDALAATNSALTVNAKGAALFDGDSGKLLFQQGGNERLPPASVTKVMTMLLVLESVDAGKISLDDKVTISDRAAGMGGSQMYMEPGEQHSLEELMQGIAMVSANDACVSVAEYLSGSVEIFVENMNKRAKELGMKNTNFVNTNGLPAEGHYSSAVDIGIMSAELLKYAKGHEWFTTWQSTIKVGLPGKESEFGLTNTNKLIKQYPGAIGIKTGFTQDAGYCLSGAATKGETTLIAVVLGCETTKVRFAEISKLLDYGFANYETVKILAKGQEAGALEIDKGSPQAINIVAKENITVLVKKGEKDKITTKTEISKNLQAPIKKGEEIGKIVVFNNNKEVQSSSLVAEKSVDKASFGEIYKTMLKSSIL